MYGNFNFIRLISTNELINEFEHIMYTYCPYPALTKFGTLILDYVFKLQPASIFFYSGEGNKPFSRLYR